MAELKARQTSFTGALGDLAVVGQSIAAGILQPLDWSKVPNVSLVDPTFRKAYSHGVPSDYGKVGIGTGWRSTAGPRWPPAGRPASRRARRLP